MNTYGGVNVYIHIFLTLALVGGEGSASCPCHFTPGTYWIGGYGQRREETILNPTGTRTLTTRSSSP
jgi:hypothetical protein